jgi:hypothetical protein
MDRPIVAEVFYDATGDDTGHEFVELTPPRRCSLAGLRLSRRRRGPPLDPALTGGAAD